jgi:hypothetical protein
MGVMTDVVQDADVRVAQRRDGSRLALEPLLHLGVARHVLSKAFAREAHRQSLAVATSRHAKKDQDFIDAISAWDAE